MLGYKFHINFFTHWSFLWEGDQNWYNFVPLSLETEFGTYKGKYFDLTFCILNFGFYVEVYHTKSREAFGNQMNKLISEWETDGISEER